MRASNTPSTLDHGLKTRVKWKNWKRYSNGDYWYAKILEHPNANKWGGVREHRVIMENKIGRIGKWVK